MKTTATIMALSFATIVAGMLVACNSKKVECDNCAAADAGAPAVQAETPAVDAGETDQ